MYNRCNAWQIPQNWLKIAKDQIKHSTQMRLYQRFDKLQEVINRSIESKRKAPFRIDQSLKQLICQQILSVIDQYEGYKINRDTFPKSEEDVIKKARTWWNRLSPYNIPNYH